MEAAIALREQPEIRELFEVLEGNGLKKERQEVESLVNYLEGMESQFGEVIKELKDLCEEKLQHGQRFYIRIWCSGLLKCGKRKPEVIPLALLPYIFPAPSLL